MPDDLHDLLARVEALPVTAGVSLYRSMQGHWCASATAHGESFTVRGDTIADAARALLDDDRLVRPPRPAEAELAVVTVEKSTTDRSLPWRVMADQSFIGRYRTKADAERAAQQARGRNEEAVRASHEAIADWSRQWGGVQGA